jgi:hypothetical protein
MRPAWRRCRAQIADLRDALERWQQDFNELQHLDLVKLVPNLPAFGAEIETRLTQIERMFAGDPPTRLPSPIKLEVCRAGAQNADPFRPGRLERQPAPADACGSGHARSLCHRERHQGP